MQKERRKKLVIDADRGVTEIDKVYLLAAALLLIDQATKILTRLNLAEGESLPLISGLFHLTHVENSGAAFGILANGRILLISVSILTLFILVFFNQTQDNLGRIDRIALSLLIGGALSNLFDRITIGTVTDFLDFLIWPVFNLADAAITVGMIILVFSQLFLRRSS